jgi:polyisoprenoid-binding protein YceI
MRQLILSAALIAGVMSCGSTAIAEDYVVDKSHAYVGFEIDHLGFSTTLGRFSDFDTAIHADWEHPEKSKLQVTIRSASIDTGWAARDKHLRTPDFFDVAEHPEISFVSKKIEVLDASEANITGDLTMLGVTKPLTLKATLVKRGPHPFNPQRENVGIKAIGVLKRSDWGMTAHVPAVGDEVTLRIEAELKSAE